MSKTQGTFGRVGIIGMGLIGGSIAKAERARRPKGFVAALAFRSGDAKKALKAGSVDQISPDLSSLLAEVDVLILAVPLSQIIPLARRIAKDAKRPLVVLDVGSVKGSIAKEFEKLSRDGVEFLATHPMAGSEKAGFDASDEGLFEGAPWVVVPHAKNRPQTMRKAAAWIRGLGARPLTMGAEEHDEKAALISHLPGLISQALFQFVETQDSSALKMAGPGFRSMTRLAHSNPQLRSEIARFNRKHIDRLWKKWLQFLSQFLQNKQFYP